MHLLFRILSLLPLPLLHGLGNLLGWLLWLVPNKRRRTAATNIARCLPELSPREQSRLLRRSLCHETKSLVESPRLWAGPVGTLDAVLREVRGAELIDQALARGKGVIIAAPHIGAWEVVGLECSRRCAMTTLYKAQRGDWDPLIKTGRERFGARLVPSEHGGVRQLLQALKRGEMIGILPDQDPPVGSGAFAPFFGIAAHTPVLISRLAHRTGAAVIYSWAERLNWGRGYILHFLSAPAGVADSDDVRAATAVNVGVEGCVHLKAEQYWWGYARFRRRQAGEPGFYV